MNLQIILFCSSRNESKKPNRTLFYESLRLCQLLQGMYYGNSEAGKHQFQTDHNQIFYVFIQSLFDGYHSAFMLEVNFNPTTENKLTNVCNFSTVQTL